MSKKVKPGVDVRAPNPTKAKRMGRSSGPMVFNEHVGRMVTPKMDKAINNNRQKK
jgi:hypothetical protein